VRASVRVWGSVGALLLLTACPQQQEKSKAKAPAPAAAERPEPNMGQGDVRVEVRDGRVTIACQDAPRGLVVEKLARQAGFELTGDLDSQPTTLAVDDVPMDQVLPTLMAGVAYRAQWRFDKEQSRHDLAKLEVGEVPTTVASSHKPHIADALRDRLRAMREKKPNEKAKAEAQARREERARTQADALEELRSSNPDMRMDAAGEIEPEGPALTSLMSALSTDADPRVRAKIATQLADADGCVASMGLVGATADPDPAVRCAAWESLEMNCDESMLPSMQPQCAKETDAKVRECCNSTLEMCQ
jgi:HEAT repeat protein